MHMIIGFRVAAAAAPTVFASTACANTATAAPHTSTAFAVTRKSRSRRRCRRRCWCACTGIFRTATGGPVGAHALAQQAQAIGDNGEGGAHIHQNRAPQGELAQGCQHQRRHLGRHAGGDVGQDGAAGSPPQPQHPRQRIQVVPKHAHWCRLEGGGGPAGPHGDAHVSGREGRGVIYSVAHHRHRRPRGVLVRPHLSQLVGGKQCCVHVGRRQSHRGGHSVCRTRAISSRHDTRHLEGVQLSHHSGRAGALLV
mmetsp:Transcript_12653/g.38135  ORF Transcript_12653/g.38135 Transcript_12653/m.38135 type:complete len:253 (+) Transcript_12653:1092-1850(+)